MLPLISKRIRPHKLDDIEGYSSLLKYGHKFRFGKDLKYPWYLYKVKQREKYRVVYEVYELYNGHRLYHKWVNQEE